VAGLTLATRPPDIYRALIESTAFGTRVITDAFEAALGPAIHAAVAAGAYPDVPAAAVMGSMSRRQPPYSSPAPSAKAALNEPRNPSAAPLAKARRRSRDPGSALPQRIAGPLTLGMGQRNFVWQELALAE
jgi:L-ribulokinase